MTEQVPSKELGCYVMDGVTYTSHADGSETSRKATDEEVLLADALLRTSDELRVANKRIESYETLRNPAKGRLVHAGSAPEPPVRQCNHGAISPKGTMFYHGFVGPANRWRCDVCKGKFEGNLTEPGTPGSQSLTLVSSSQPPSPEPLATVVCEWIERRRKELSKQGITSGHYIADLCLLEEVMNDCLRGASETKGDIHG